VDARGDAVTEDRAKPRSPLVALVMAAAAVLLALHAYGEVLWGPFVFDDLPGIVNNAVLRAPDWLAAAWRYEPARFVTVASFAANFRLGGLDPFGYHLVNVVLHLANAALCGYAVAWMLGRRGQPRFPVAAICALLFLTHPLMTQAVSYVHQRAASLATLGYVGALAAYMRVIVARESGAMRPALAWLGVAVGAATLATFSKQMAVTLPAAVVLTDLVFGRGTTAEAAAPSVRRLAWAAPLLAPVALLAVAMASVDVTTETQLAAFNSGGIGRAEYFWTQMRVVWSYLRLVVWPVGQNLDHDVVPSPGSGDVFAWLGAAALAAVAVVAFLRRREAPLAAWGVAFAFIAASVESSVVPIRDLMFEHRMYLPFLGILAVVAELGAFADARLRRSRQGTGPNRLVVAAVVAAAFVPLAELTRRRNEVYTDDVRLWSDVVQKSPRKTRGYVNLGAAYLRAGAVEDAERTFKALLAFAPEEPSALFELSRLQLEDGRYEEALATAARLAEFSPGDVTAQQAIGRALMALGRDDEAKAALEQALAGAEESLSGIGADHGLGTKARHFRRFVLIDLGLLARRRGDPAAAEAWYQRLLAVSPGDPLALVAQGEAALERDDLAVARQRFSEARVGDALAAQAVVGLGEVAEAEGKNDVALAHYQEALGAGRDLETALRVAALLARVGRGDDATKLAEAYARPGSTFRDTVVAKLTAQRGLRTREAAARQERRLQALCERGILACGN
jgi:tetratricopeptide (TPR) repeat protein